jgi:hypothetical protein
MMRRGLNAASALAAARPMARALAALRYALAFRTPPRVPIGAEAFTGHRNGVLPLLWTVAALSLVEVTLVHLLIRRWSAPAAIGVSLFSELGVVYMLGVGNSLRCLPTLVEPEGVRVRLGLLIDQPIAWADIAHAGVIVGEAGPKTRDVLRAAAISPPNVRLRLSRLTSVGRSGLQARQVSAIELYLDDPKAFCAIVAARLA